MKFCLILGTRPEIIKLSPVIRAFKEAKKAHFMIHTNQHYSYEMDQMFFKELKINMPKYNLGVSKTKLHGEMTGAMLARIESVLLKEKPSCVIVQGDTNSALAGALSAAKLNIPIAHVEAGLRSYDRTMPEEVNRVLIDHMSDYLFCPTKKAKDILLKEGLLKSNIFVTGNTIVDAVYYYSKTLSAKFSRDNQYGDYILLTMHRPSNVDSKKKLKLLISGLTKLSFTSKMPILFPIHPRTKKRIQQFKIKINPKHIRLAKPTNFIEMLRVEQKAKLIITDSGGLQEEACILGIPCITLRENTERPETVEVGANRLVGTNTMNLLEESIRALRKKTRWKNPFGNGRSAQAIVKTLVQGLSSL